MVGGIVKEVIVLNRHKVWVNCRGTGSEEKTECAVYCDPGEYNPICIMPGDSFWWHGPYCYWRIKTMYYSSAEITLAKISYSGVRRPTRLRRLLALLRWLRRVPLHDC